MNTRNWLSRSIVTATTTLFLLSTCASAEKNGDPPRIVTWSCSGCHAVDGNAQQPSFPRLGALDAPYIEQRVTTFRTAPVPPADELVYKLVTLAGIKKKSGAITREGLTNMVGMAHAATPEEVKAAAAWYALQKAAPGRRSFDAALIATGKALYANGVPARNVLACQDCHGEQAQGMATFPRLAGQNDAYLLGQLARFRSGERGHSPMMTSVAQHLDGEESRAVATYLETQ